MSVFAPHCWISSIWTHLAGGRCCRIPPTNKLKLKIVFRKSIFTTQRNFEPISLRLTFPPQLKVVGLLNSAHECARPSFLDSFFVSDTPLLAAVVVGPCEPRRAASQEHTAYGTSVQRVQAPRKAGPCKARPCQRFALSASCLNYIK